MTADYPEKPLESDPEPSCCENSEIKKNVTATATATAMATATATAMATARATAMATASYSYGYSASFLGDFKYTNILKHVHIVSSFASD